MEITRLPQSYLFSLTNLVAKGAGGPVPLPVQPSDYPYSQLKNIRGVPAPRGRPGYSLGKLQSLDKLIERLRGLKGKAAYEVPSQVDEGSLDRMIQYYQRELKQSLRTQVPVFLGNPIRDQGLTLDLFA